MVKALVVSGLTMSVVKGTKIQYSDANTTGGVTLETVTIQTTLESNVILIDLVFVLFIIFVYFFIPLLNY